jgi:hypothetical protein
VPQNIFHQPHETTLNAAPTSSDIANIQKKRDDGRAVHDAPPPPDTRYRDEVVEKMA